MFLLHKKRSAQEATRYIWNMTAYGSLYLARKANQFALLFELSKSYEDL